MEQESMSRNASGCDRLPGRIVRALGLAVGLLFLLPTCTVRAEEPKEKAARKDAAKEKPRAGKQALPENPFPDARFEAPPLEGGLGWLNTAGPIEMSKLKGKVVLLDFWTYCCINCMHVLPDLAKLEAEFPNELVVIGVHSAKFEGERDTQNIREAIRRYDIRHPVVNDGQMKIWRRYGVRSWPTRLLIAPDGLAVFGRAGEGNLEQFREAIRAMIAYHKAKGTLDSTPIHFELEDYAAKPTPLKYPGKVAVDAKTGRLFVADSSHHRIVIADAATGKLQQVIGSGIPGLVDGSLADARFNDPQGMAFDGSRLYVADAKNHAIRKIDLKAGAVTTIAGDGTRGGYGQAEGAKGTEVAIASPWDLLKVGDRLYVAMAGTHQIWRMDLSTAAIAPFAGNGRETITDGPADSAEFAQPSGFATDGTSLFVADSEVSAIRRVNLETGATETIVGEGLFEFGDVDGVGDEVRLQHALGVAFKDGILYVADTYNDKIKKIDPKTRRCDTYLGDGQQGDSDSPPRFNEPSGLAIVGEKLFVADTNNHRIRVVDLADGSVSTLRISGLEPPTPAEEDLGVPTADATDLPPVSLVSGQKLRLTGSVLVPANHKLNPMAPMSYRVETVDAAGKATRIARGRIKPIKASFDVGIDSIPLEGAKQLRVTVTYYPCETGSEGVCRIKTRVWNIPVELGSDRPVTEIRLPAKSATTADAPKKPKD